ncbi:MAG: hypothetical protein IJT97_09450 [Bacteroidaceae bacterium]|nr:hypothetical protein [Bacteroidaceae bacterium]
MKKILLTASLLIASMSATFAQVPDASQWKVGDEITDQVNFGNPSFENATKDPWQFTMSKGSTTETGGLFECYDGADEDLYQYVLLPAGMYRVECQGYYRCGTSWDDDPNSYGDPERWQDNALLYAQNGTYDIDSDEFTAGRTFKCPLMPRLFLNQLDQLYVGPKEGEEGYPGWDMSDGNYGEKGWGPCSVPGSLVWFQAGLYAPVDDGENKYNTESFFLTEDGYARIGVMKTDPRSADSFMATNFKIYYEGEADEAIELIAMQDEVAEYYNKLADLRDSYEGGLIYTLIDDALYEFDDKFISPDNLTTKEECQEALDMLKPLYDQAVAAQATVAQLQNIISVMELLYNTTDYPGKAAFHAALQEAQDCLDPDYQAQEGDDFDKFQEAYDNVIAARVTYLLSQEMVNGAINLSALINTPFFCDNQYTPVWNEEAQAYQFPAIEGVAEELQPENTWATIQEQGYSEAKAADGREEWTPICDNVKVYEKFVENQWVIKSTTWHGGSAAAVTMQHSYPAIGGWTAEPSGNPELLYQTITGLPDGYYSMSALMCNAGADISPLQFAYIETESTKETAPLTMKGNPWWGGNREAWRSGVWQKLTTNMVYVSGGKVTIGTSSDAFYASTGFQLYYYGETPDFSALIGPSIAAAKANIETLTWAGDIAAANAILAKIPETINSQEAYEATLATLAEVNDYVTTATNTIDNWKALDNFTALADQQPEGSVEALIAEVAVMQVLTLGEGENDTYKDALAADDDYAAYASYLEYRASMAELAATDDALKAMLDEQGDTLSTRYATAAELAEFQAQLAAPYNKALLASLGIDKATPENPVDISVLLVNPNFDEGRKGWIGSPEFTYTSSEAIQEELGAVEYWNTNFNVYQTIYSLPAGLYRVQAQACYRDDGGATTAYNNWWYDAGGDIEEWANPNAKLYANNKETTIVSLASELFTEKSMSIYCNAWVQADEADEQGNLIYVKHYRAQDSISAEPYVAEYQKYVPEGEYPSDYISINGGDWWWDTQIEDVDEFYYYPASLMGISKRYAANPDAYINTAETNVREGGSLTVGIKKEVMISGDWVPFDNFKLFYCGKVTIGIDDITNLIEDYLTEGSTVKLDDITALIDQYLEQEQ